MPVIVESVKLGSHGNSSSQHPITRTTSLLRLTRFGQSFINNPDKTIPVGSTPLMSSLVANLCSIHVLRGMRNFGQSDHNPKRGRTILAPLSNWMDLGIYAGADQCVAVTLIPNSPRVFANVAVGSSHTTTDAGSQYPGRGTIRSAIVRSGNDQLCLESGRLHGLCTDPRPIELGQWVTPGGATVAGAIWVETAPK